MLLTSSVSPTIGPLVHSDVTSGPVSVALQGTVDECTSNHEDEDHLKLLRG